MPQLEFIQVTQSVFPDFRDKGLGLCLMTRKNHLWIQFVFQHFAEDLVQYLLTHPR